MQVMKGRVWKFGNNINTDVIYPGQYLHLPPTKVKERAFEAIRPKFYELIKPGDVIVAGKNFGCGSSREGASSVLKELGLGACIADSMARIYFRNCIAIGFPVFTHMGISSLFNEGDEIKINVATGETKNLTTGEAVKAKPLPEPILKILEAGGLMPQILKITEEKRLCNSR